MHEIRLMGNIAKDFELGYTNSGTAKVSLTIPDKRKIGEKEHTEWFHCTAFGKTAENIARFFKKGSAIFLIGYLQTNEWKGRDGTTKRDVRLMIEKFEFVPKDYSDTKSAPKNAPQQQNLNDAYKRAMEMDGYAEDDDDLPF